MAKTPSLRNLQLWLQWIVTDPRGVKDALGSPRPDMEKYKSRYTSPTPSYFELISQDSTSATERLNVYAEGYFSRILDCLKESFAKTHASVGEAVFTKLVAEYLKAHPSTFTSIDEVGRYFADFLSKADTFPLPGWVSDLARFEWRWIESFYSADVTAEPDWQNKLNENPDAPLQVHPSVRWVQSQWPLSLLIRTLEAGHEMDPGNLQKEAHTTLIIYRFNDNVRWEELTPPLFEILRHLIEGKSLAESLQQAQDIDPREISHTFMRWVERGLLCGLLDRKVDSK